MKAINLTILFCISSFIIATTSNAQNWNALYGNNERNGISKLSGPEQVTTPLWTVNDAAYTSFGMNIYSQGEIFVTSRYNMNGDVSSVIECRSLMDGELLWTSPYITDSTILHVTAINEDAVYGHDYKTGVYYSFNADDGSIVWSHEGSYCFGPMDSPLFTCEGNPIINGAGTDGNTLYCLDKNTGEEVWKNTDIVPIHPNKLKAAYKDRIYMVTGTIYTTINLVAIDMETGESLYYTDDLPGSAFELGPMIAPDGTIYIYRHDGYLYSFTDTGSDFELNWTYTPESVSLYTCHSLDLDGNPLIVDNGKITRINKEDGTQMNSSEAFNFDGGRLICGANSVIYINNTTESMYYAMSYDLQNILWSKPISGNYYSGPGLCKEGIMIFSGQGTTITAYKSSDEHAPVADFETSERHILVGESIDFFDLSSFNPTTWYWEFPGANTTSSNEQNPENIVYDEAGVYEVTLEVSNNLGDDVLSKNCYIVVGDVSGFEDYEFEEISLYPNPGTDVLNLKNLPGNSHAKIEILNINGQIILEQNIDSEFGTVNVNGLSKGIYSYRIIVSNKAIQFGKWIKM